MIDVLKVLGRVILIGFGLMSIAVGGLCTVVGSSSGSGAGWMVAIGAVSLLIGGAVVWLTFRGWLARPATEPGSAEAAEKENP
ncbi:MAG: hypothetical protein CVU31_09610 [Betaproteobacteria bacterium HGW-Betaproteobacteria-4]|jgi:hypothetical protein|nr:MAG: hypothetical protein CVU31_09610 [Betaproteobacteria bacterium HGW-Betaproteobacteria-4]